MKERDVLSPMKCYQQEWKYISNQKLTSGL